MDEGAGRGSTAPPGGDLYHEVLDELPVGVVIHAPDTSILFCNRKAAELLGLPQAEVPGRTASDAAWWFIGEDGHRLAAEEYPVSLALGSSSPTQTWVRGIVRSDRAAPIWVQAEARRVVDGAGALQRVVVTFSDVTVSKLRDQARLAGERRYRLLFDGAIEGIYRASADGRRLEANAALAAMLGYPSGAALTERGGAAPHDVWADGADKKRFNQLLLEHGSVSGFECQFVRLDGRRIWVSISARTVPRDGDEPAHRWGFVTDITARRNTEAALRAGEERHRLAFEEAPIAVVINRDQQILHANLAALRLLGLPSREAMLSLPALDWYAPQERAAHRERMRESKAGLRATEPIETVVLRADGTQLPVQMFAASTTFSDGPATVVFALDLSDRKREEAEKAHLTAQLQQAQKMESVGRLAGGVAHDFNNLLSVILTYTTLSRKKLRPEDPLSVDLGEVERAALQATALTRQLLAFSRQQVLQPVPLDLADAIGEAARMLARLLGENVRLDVRRGAGPAVVLADPGQINQVVMNLAVNARDAMPRGGRLTLATESVELDAAAVRELPNAKPGRYVRLTVEDTGTGMDEATQARVFEPFFTTKAVGKGTGLGLATVYGIVRQSGGYVSFRSELGRGTAFEIGLPQIEGNLARQAPPPEVEKVGAGETVLVVDDDEGMRRTVRRALEAAGYRVVVAASAEEALGLQADSSRPLDLLLTDVVLPGRDGCELAQQMRARQPGLRVIFMSGYLGDSEPLQRVLNEKARLVTKPISAGSLAAEVQRALAAPNGG